MTSSRSLNIYRMFITHGLYNNRTSTRIKTCRQVSTSPVLQDSEWKIDDIIVTNLKRLGKIDSGVKHTKSHIEVCMDKADSSPRNSVAHFQRDAYKQLMQIESSSTKIEWE